MEVILHVTEVAEVRVLLPGDPDLREPARGEHAGNLQVHLEINGNSFRKLDWTKSMGHHALEEFIVDQLGGVVTLLQLLAQSGQQIRACCYLVSCVLLSVDPETHLLKELVVEVNQHEDRARLDTGGAIICLHISFSPRDSLHHTFYGMS